MELRDFWHVDFRQRHVAGNQHEMAFRGAEVGEGTPTEHGQARTGRSGFLRGAGGQAPVRRRWKVSNATAMMIRRLMTTSCHS